MKELWNKAAVAGGSGSDEQRLLICALASQVTLGPLECSESGDCWFFSVACGGRPLYLLWLRDDREVAAEALHASLSAFTDGAAAHEAAVASLTASGLSPEAAASRVDVCGTVELIRNLCWQQASHMLFPMWHAVCKGTFHDFGAISPAANARRCPQATCLNRSSLMMKMLIAACVRCACAALASLFCVLLSSLLDSLLHLGARCCRSQQATHAHTAKTNVRSFPLI